MIRIISFLIIGVLGSFPAFGANYECIDGVSDRAVKISTEAGKGNFQYIVGEKVKFEVGLPDEAIRDLNLVGADRTIINYSQFGESTINVYGRINNDGSSLFDVYASGMLGYLIEEMVGFNCKII